MSERFDWRDGERTVHFGRGRLAEAPALLGEGYALLCTARSRASAPAVVDAAASVHDVGAGNVAELAAGLLDAVPAGAPLVVALGGGRVIDTAKAVAAVHGTRAAAIPTTLSAAEMTWVGQLPQGAGDVERRRPAIVVNDPALSASQPGDELAASAANSLAHAIEGRITTRTSPVPRLAAGEAIALTSRAYARAAVDDDARDDLALAAVLSGYAIDSAWYGLHHVLSQTLRAVGGAGHGPANAVMLPRTARALAARGLDVGDEAIALADDLAARAGAAHIRDLGVDRALLATCADAAARRAELDHTPPRAGRDEILALYDAAW